MESHSHPHLWRRGGEANQALWELQLKRNLSRRYYGPQLLELASRNESASLGSRYLDNRGVLQWSCLQRESFRKDWSCHPRLLHRLNQPNSTETSFLPLYSRLYYLQGSFERNLWIAAQSTSASWWITPHICLSRRRWRSKRCSRRESGMLTRKSQCFPST